MIWKIQTSQVKEEIYYSLEKGCCKKIRETDDLLFIDQHILKEVKTRQKNVATTWIDNKKTYDIVPQTWILECLKVYKISDKVINFITKAMKEELTAGGKTLTEMKI